MRDDFAVLILTHGRAHEQKTYTALRKQGYTGKCYFVLDNMDEQADEYKSIYGEENVLIFDKEEAWQKTDTFFNKKNLLAVVFARNASFQLAKNVGLKWFVNCDDDIENFSLKVPIKGKLITKNISQFDHVLESMIGFMEATSSDCLGISEEGCFVGGVNESVKKGLQWSCTHWFLMNVNSPLRFRGQYLEDMLFSIETEKMAKLVYSTMLVSQRLPSLKAVKKQEGGMHETYKADGGANNYVAMFSCVIANPDCFKIKRSSDGTWKRSMRQDAFRAKIINEKYKKISGGTKDA